MPFRNGVFTLNAKAKKLLTLFLFFPLFELCASTHELQFGAQLSKENTYRDTLNPFLDYSNSPLSWFQIKTGTGLLISTKDLESFTYRIELTATPTSWLAFVIRGSQRAQLPEAFSRTSLLGAAKLRGDLGKEFSFFLSAGFYERWVALNHANFFPFSTESSFSQQDFATELGFTLSLSPTLRGLMKVATFDPWEVYNLNNPFIETSFYLGAPDKPSQWLATFRYHLLLGFGRLDRLTFGLTYLTQW